MQRAQEGLQGCLLVDGEMDEVARKAKQVGAEVYLTGGQGILAEAYLGGVLGLEPKEAWWAAQNSTPAWHTIGSYERLTQSWRQLQGKERLERVQKCHG